MLDILMMASYRRCLLLDAVDDFGRAAIAAAFSNDERMIIRYAREEGACLALSTMVMTKAR